MAINADFRHEADPGNSPEQQLHLFEEDLRSRFADKLSAVLSSPIAGPAFHHNVPVLKDLLAAVKGAGQARLSFEHEKVLPVSIEHDSLGFKEALLRVHGEGGNAVTPKKLFGALSDPALDSELASSFRLWLIFAAIREFHAVPRTMGLSVNVVPHDLDSPAYRESLERGLELFQKCPYSALVLEATEYDPWTPSRLSFIKAMVKKYDLALAVDDYGAPDGYNQEEALANFAEGVSAGKLIVKVDGQVVMDFLQNRNIDLVSRLNEIKALCDDPIVIAEWVPSVGDTRVLLDRLRPYGLDGMIGLVQSSSLQDETPSSFLRKMSLLPENKPELAP